jgi:LDH2 family malate/lactate/ureidoglycolate dehydrogenase
MTQPLSASRFSAEALRDWAAAVLVSQGVPMMPAALAAKVLVRTSLRGIDTHGIARLASYAAKLATGEVNPIASPAFDTRQGILKCNGDGGLGQIVATLAIDQALDAARTSALVACRIEHTGHLGALGTYVVAAAERGMFSILCQRTPPIMAMPGARKPVIGNNPIAFAVPVAGRAPLVFDMAHSVVARGQIVQALREGQETIPGEWAIGPDGAPTTNPALALQGAMQPVAGYKGLGLAMLVECLAGSLNGIAGGSAADPSNVSHGSEANVSGFLIMINPALAVGQQEFDASVTAWLKNFLEGSGADARYPGQRQAASEEQRLKHGVPIPAGLFAELRDLGDKVGCAFDLTPVG